MVKLSNLCLLVAYLWLGLTEGENKTERTQLVDGLLKQDAEFNESIGSVTPISWHQVSNLCVCRTLDLKQQRLHKEFAKHSCTSWADFLLHGEPLSILHIAQLVQGFLCPGPRDGKSTEQTAKLVVDDLLQLHKKLGTRKVISAMQHHTTHTRL